MIITRSKYRERVLNKAALVTGGAIRIGREIALSLAAAGWDVVLHYSSSAEDARRTADEIRGLGVDCQLIGCDLADSRRMLELLPAAVGLAPGLELLVNNASLFERSPLVETETELFDSHMAVNLRAPFFLTRDFARLCGQGQVLNLLDTRIVRNELAYAAYTLTKKALAELTRMAARELAPRIRVNAVAPGLILPSAGGDSEQFERMAARIPLECHGHPRQIAEAAMYLIGSEFVTGQIIHVDGGEHLL
jgi:pteridine reductase